MKKAPYNVDKENETDPAYTRRSFRKKTMTFTTASKSNQLAKYQSTRSSDEDLFLTNDTPIFRLPQECILRIFSYYTDIKALTTIANVCKKWRRTALQPFLWKSVHYEFHHFKSLTITSPFHQEENITSIPNLSRLINVPSVSPFEHLSKIRLADLYIEDISKIVKTFNQIKTLICDNIRREDNRVTVHLSMFSHLIKLEELQLHFHKPCNLGGAITPFFNRPSSISPIFPASLKALHLLNIYDFEESVMRARDAGRSEWEQPVRPIHYLGNAEEDLLIKYKMITSRICLQSLSLNRCSALTANIWRTCMIPCTQELEYLSLTGRKRDVSREPPEDDPFAFLDLEGLENASRKLELEKALTEFFGGLRQIKEISLDDFICSKGLVSGIEKLAVPYKINGESDVSINSYLNKTLFNVKLSFQH
ncbi:hypothetical protein G6F57_002774 [Rhizopus arrhizus]|uniref:F-box domain-containing protein n=1 Tax=Rhizopus oryzae TaxID=64495 RepID=A0A9P7BWT1_RHIOR|nr:hypothetical protein G6F23_001397 [Rhizopus arrhizus]KAG1428688.1 hypothetical protein G6F58_000459 [Rhizopus delemar]KAG0768025.1 hypothetical protein G6F24_002301 [Rhizopus arrhizus]KAG0794582.1 hypothetical protein G6F21_002762 [Rhizopus arrhizus]KAG0801222.1 hypothetical protein G6F22_001457 [Rhizopus arrhizus]